MTLCVVGVNYRSASVELREQLAIPAHAMPEALAALRASPDIDEVVILSTCNRVECYVVSSHPAASLERVVDLWLHRRRLSPDVLRPHLYTKTGREAVSHLFAVTAGLDSLILGESEIAAQVKQAYHVAHECGACGRTLHRLFQKALHAASEVRAQTTIGQGHASIGAVVVQLAKSLFDDSLLNCEVLLWGAGKAAEATARHLIKHGVRTLSIVNRTQFKAQDLALMCQGGWLSWEQARSQLTHVDIAIVCTQAPHYVIDRDDIAAVLPQRGNRPLIVIDLAVPRNVDPSVTQYPTLHLYNVDDVQAMAQGGVVQRHHAIHACHTVLTRQVDLFWQWWETSTTQEESACPSVAADVLV